MHSTSRANERAAFEHASAKECLEGVERAWVAAEGKPQTVRSYFYALLSGYVAVKEKRKNSGRYAYQWVSRLLTKAREQGDLPWGAVTDTGTRSRRAFFHASLEEHVHGLAHSSFRLDIWRGQPKRVEVWTEKDGELEALWDICEPYRVPVNVTQGFSSTSVKHEAAEDYGTGENVVLLYVGDADPSGFDIERDLLGTLREHGCCAVTMQRVAVTDEQALTLPFDSEQDLKKRDSRIERFKREHPLLEHGYEMQAMSPRDRSNVLTAAIRAHMDLPAL